MGESHKKSRYTKIADLEPSKIDPIPYFPNLHRQLHSLAASVIVAYLEIHHPAPQDHPEAPVVLSADQMAIDLQISRRTLLVPLSFIVCWWPSEDARARGARGNREFLVPAHSRYGSTKPYSLTGPKTFDAGISWLLRRNYPFLNHILGRFDDAQSQSTRSTLHGGGAKPFTALSLGDLIVKRSVLGGDGRVTRHERERAIEQGGSSR